MNYSTGWRDALIALINYYTTERDRYLMPTNKLEQDKLRAYSRIINQIASRFDLSATKLKYKEPVK